MKSGVILRRRNLLYTLKQYSSPFSQLIDDLEISKKSFPYSGKNTSQSNLARISVKWMRSQAGSLIACAYTLAPPMTKILFRLLVERRSSAPSIESDTTTLSGKNSDFDLVNTTFKRSGSGLNLSFRDCQVFLPMITALASSGSDDEHVRARKCFMSARKFHGSALSLPMPRLKSQATTKSNFRITAVGPHQKRLSLY